MISTVPHYFAQVGLVLSVSLAVLGQNVDPCVVQVECTTCVTTKTTTTSEVGITGTCMWEVARSGSTCKPSYNPSQGVLSIVYDLKGCAGGQIYPTITTPPPNGTTTAPPTTTGIPTTRAPTSHFPTIPPTTNGTSTTTMVPPTNGTTTTMAPPTNGTTTTMAPPTNGTTTTTMVPTNTTTVAPESKGSWWMRLFFSFSGAQLRFAFDNAN